MTPSMVFEFRAQVDFLAVYQASALPSLDIDVEKRAMTRLAKLKYVDEVWIDHTCIISISTETSNAKVAERRVRDVIAKATRIIQSYKVKTP